MERFLEIDKEMKVLFIKVGASIFIVSISAYIIKYILEKLSYKRIIQKKKENLQSKKDNLFKKLEVLKKPFDTMDEITSISLEELVKSLDSGVYTPLDVLHAFQAKALLKDREYNFITDLNSNVLSDVLALTPHTKGLLKGIPISVKDTYYIKYCDCTYGMADLCLKPAESDSILIKCLRLQGAVPFVMTNMSQTGKSIESSNPIFGQTLNPHNKSKTSGGSSGGEGAILAAGGSILGLGGDIGGSIRIPSAYCGIFGLKPTSGRLSRRNIRILFPNQDFVKPSLGPMARRFEDLLTLFKCLACENMHDLDPFVPPLSFNQEMFSNKRPLRIGYYTNLEENQVKPIPAVERAVMLAKSALESAGNTLVKFQIPNIDKGFELYLQCLFTDGGYGFTKTLIKRNPVDSSMFVTVNVLRLPNILKKFFSYVIYPFNKGYSNILYSMAGVSSVYNVWELNDKLNAYKEEVLTMWQKENLDGLICPVLPITAPPCNTSQYIMDILGYTAIYNVLDFPAGSVPVTKVNQKDIEELLRSYPKDTPTHRQIINLQKDSLDMPVGVQCVTLPWKEELCLRIMKDIDTNLK